MGRKVRDVILFVLAVAGCVVLTIALGGENIFGPAMIYNLVFLGIMIVIYLFALIGGVFRLTDVSSWLQDSTEQIDDMERDTPQVCLDCGAKKVLLPQTSFVDFATVPPELMSAFQLIPYQSAEDAVFKALGVE